MNYSRRRIVKVNSSADLTFAGRGEAGGRPHELSEHESLSQVIFDSLRWALPTGHTCLKYAKEQYRVADCSH